MKITLLIILLSLSNIISAQQPTFQWVKGIGGSLNEYGACITTDTFGNIYTTGYFQGTADFDPGPGSFNLTANSQDIFISKLDVNGNFIWAKKIEGPENNISFSIATDASGNVYTTGYFKGTVDFDPGAGVFNLTSANPTSFVDAFISKLDASGNFVWAKNMGGTSSCISRSITIDDLGNVFTTGYFMGTIDFDPGIGTFNLTSFGGTDIYISKIDPTGNFIWAKSIGDSGEDRGHSIATDATGNVYTTGYFKGVSTDFDPGPGLFPLPSVGIGTDVFILKLDAAGNFIWAKSIEGTTNSTDFGNSINIGSNGYVYTTGNFQGTSDFDPGAGVFNLTSQSGASNVFLSKLDASGNFIWAKGLGGSLGSRGLSVITDDIGNIYSTGYFIGTADFDPGPGSFNLTSNGDKDVFISKLDASGNFLWAISMGATSSDVGNSIVLDPYGDLYTAGDFYMTTDFDPGAGVFNLTANSQDIFIHKLGMCEAVTGIDTQIACDSYTWPLNGTTYTTSTNVPTATLTNAGCDSIVTLNLTINNSSAGTDTQVACDSYTWSLNGATYTNSTNTPTATLINAAGCDSIVTLNLTINNSSAGTDTQVACDSYTWPLNSTTYTNSTNTPTATLTNAAGCDSIVTLNLTVNSVSDNTTTLSSNTIQANSSGASYMWLDCDDNYAVISGETNQSYTPTANGNYAVELTENGCVDTSACITITTIGIIENNFGQELLVYPNPTDGNFSIDLGATYTTVEILISDINGKLIRSEKYGQEQVISLSIKEPNGVYLITITAGDKRAIIRLIKN